MRSKPKNRSTYQEQYQVKLNYRKDDRFWVVGHVEDVDVEVVSGKNEKNNHAKAEAIAKKRYPGCVIVRVTYC